MQLALMRDPAEVDRVRQDPVQVAARYRPAALGMPGRRGEALRRPAMAIDGVLEPAHAAELQVESKDAAHRLGLGQIDDQLALMHVVAERRGAAPPHSFLLWGGGLFPEGPAGGLPPPLWEGGE